MWVPQHYITLAGAGTVFDADPTITQPGEVAQSGGGADLPLTTIRAGGEAWAKIIIVDDAGVPQAEGAATWSVKVALRTSELILPATGAAPRAQYGWVGGSLLSGAPTGSQIVQSQLQAPAEFVAVVVGGANVPMSGRLVVSTWRDSR